MGLVNRFTAACVLAAAGGASAGGTICIANVCTNSGSMPSGTYTNNNGVITTPGNMPADAYIRGPYGQKTPLNNQQVPSQEYNLYPSNRINGSNRINNSFGAVPEDSKLVSEQVIRLESKNGTGYCSPDILDDKKLRNIRQLCVDFSKTLSEGQSVTLVKHPFTNKSQLPNGSVAFCREGVSPKGQKNQMIQFIPAGNQIDCLFVKFEKT